MRIVILILEVGLRHHRHQVLGLCFISQVIQGIELLPFLICRPIHPKLIYSFHYDVDHKLKVSDLH
jgi:hypothetical protein